MGSKRESPVNQEEEEITVERMMARRTPPLPGAAALLLAAALLASSPPARGLAFRTSGPSRAGDGRSITWGTRGAAVDFTATAGPRADRRRLRPSDWALASTESGVEEMTAEVNGVNGDASAEEEVETAEVAAEIESSEDDEAEEEEDEKSEEEKFDEAMMAQAIMMANSAGGERGSREF